MEKRDYKNSSFKGAFFSVITCITMLGALKKRMENLEHMEKITDLFRAKERHRRWRRFDNLKPESKPI
jgi:hypothetical protein